MNPPNPRDLALRRLCEGDQLSPATPFFPDARDRALYQELVRGVTRHRRLLDWHIQNLASRPLEKIHPKVLNTMRLGLYQILFLHVPDHAAVSESVNLIGRHGQVKAKAFVNAALRRFLREAPQPPQDQGIALSYPATLLDLFRETAKWAGLSSEETTTLLKTFNEPLRVCLRVNRRKAARDIFIETLRKQLPHLFFEKTTASPDGILVQGHDDLTRWPGFADGFFMVQSESSQLIAPLLAPFEPGLRILDACAAPGGKLAHIAELAGERSEITALAAVRRSSSDESQKRLTENLQRMGLKTITVIEKTAEDFAKTAQPESFDRILVDAPCTGLGTLAKHPERKWLFQEKYPEKLAKEQHSILEALWPLLKKGGILVYSVCSMTLPEWREGLGLAAKGGELLGPPENLPIDWKLFFHPQHQAFIFWPQRLKSEGLFAVRLQKQ